MREVIEINKNIIPYDFNILLGNEVFNIRIDYNNTGGFFTADLSKEDEPICYGEPIVYGIPLFSDIYQNDKFPVLDIVPFDESKSATAVTFDNLSETVLLIIDNGSEPIE